LPTTVMTVSPAMGFYSPFGLAVLWGWPPRR
jgi:hypothetical protein